MDVLFKIQISGHIKLIPDWHYVLRIKVFHFMSSNDTTSGLDERVLLTPLY